MKKWIIIAIGLLLVLAWAVLYFVPQKVLSMITEYEPYTFERILPYDSARAHYGIYDNNDPSDYGYDQVEEISYRSDFDGKNLSAWYVGSAPESGKCILLLHGRTSNRLKTMKFLELFKATGLDSVYNFLVPDLRNSGKSEASSTYMGYRFADDIASSIKWVRENQKQDTVILYGFSMGAMAIEILLAREDLAEEAQRSYVSKIILDSPLSDVKGSLWLSAQDLGLPEGFFNYCFGKFSDLVDGFGDKMHLGYLLSQNDRPTLIMASDSDQLTPFELLTDELAMVEKPSHIQFHAFTGIPHVKLYQTDSTKGRYTSLVNEFLRQ
jgi:hypothetical protein